MKHLISAVVAATLITLCGCAEERPPAPTPTPTPTPAPTPTPTPTPDPAQTEPQPPAGTEAQDLPHPAPPPAAPETPEVPEPAPAIDPLPPEPAPETGQVLETIQTDSGLIIEILRHGTGEVVRSGDTIVVHYHGQLADGRIFDSSVQRGEPATLNLFETVPGWREGIPGTRIGGKRRLIIPSELGFGRRGTSNIPPDSMLIFEIEILDIVR